MKNENLINDRPHIKIKRFPDELNPDKMIENTIFHRDVKCPFCKNSDLSMMLYEKHYKGQYKQKPLIKNLFGPKLSWYYFAFKCLECRAEWESEEFPQGLSEDNKYIFSDKNDLLQSFLCSIVGFLVLTLLCRVLGIV